MAPLNCALTATGASSASVGSRKSRRSGTWSCALLRVRWRRVKPLPHRPLYRGRHSEVNVAGRGLRRYQRARTPRSRALDRAELAIEPAEDLLDHAVQEQRDVSAFEDRVMLLFGAEQAEERALRRLQWKGEILAAVYH